MVSCGPKMSAIGLKMSAVGPKWSDGGDSSMKRGILWVGMKDTLYTIGQRRGLGIHLNRPVFVKEIYPEKNEVVLSSLSALEKTEMQLKDWNLVNPQKILGYNDVIVKIRYRKQENHCTVTVTPDNLLHVQLHEPLTAIAAGQAAAFYRDGLLLGGGIIVNAR